MKFSIFGTGNMGTSLATVLSKKHQLTIYDRDESKAKELAGKFGVEGKKLGEPIDSDVVILALPYHAISQVLEEYADLLENKIIVDISNAMDWQRMELLPNEGALTIAKSLPSGAKLIKAFNTIPAAILAQGVVDEKPVDVFLAGDDQEAKDALVKATDEAGLRAIDVGPLSHAPYLESLLLINSLAGMKVGGGKPVSTKILQ